MGTSATPDAFLAKVSATRKKKRAEAKTKKKVDPFAPLVYTGGYMPQYVIGIDPGLAGAITVLDRKTMTVIYVDDCPTVQGGLTKKAQSNKASVTYYKKGMLDILRHIVTNIAGNRPDNIQVFMERSQVMVRNGFQQGSVSNFTIGYGYGLWDMALSAMDLLNLKTIPPVEWSKRLFHNSVYAEIADTKARSIAFVKAEFPEASLIPDRPRCKAEKDGRADAICIADYGIYFYMEPNLIQAENEE